MTHPVHVNTTPDGGLNTASLVLGILSVVIPLVGLITAPLAIIFANVARGRGNGNGAGTAGLVLGIIVSAAYAVFFALVITPPLAAL